MIDFKQTTEVQRALAKLLENRKWLDENIYELQNKYRGKTIAVHEKQVVAVGKTAEEVREIIKDKHPEDEALIMLIPSEEIIEVPYPE